MRIGFEMLAVQSPHHGHRGIGRYSRELLSALLSRDDGSEYFLYAHDRLPIERIPFSRATLRWIGSAPELGEGSVSHVVDRLARTNPDQLDVLVVLSPFEHWLNYHPPSRPISGLKLAAIVYDMIPFLFPRDMAYDPSLVRFYRVLDDVRRYDALLAISEATRRDCLDLLGLPEDRVVTISSASDDRFFTPSAERGPTAEASALLAGLGVNRPFVLNVGGMVDRKNWRGLIDAFARLPEALRHAHQLVLTFMLLPEERRHVEQCARSLGIQDSLVITGEVSDEALRELYRGCAAFAFPSLYEGFGLPLLEAMHCGAAVIGGNNSSQVEVVGEAGLLANASDPGDIAAKLARILEDRAFARTLGERALEHARTFSWNRTADRTTTVLEGLVRTRPVARFPSPRLKTPKPQIAYFSPFPPRKSGISDYSIALVRELSRTYQIDLFHETGYVPDLGLGSDEFPCIDGRLFARHHAVKDYHAIVYQMGNSRHHTFLYDVMLEHPGIVTLHDFCLAGFHLLQAKQNGLPADAVQEELLRWHPEHAQAIRAEWPTFPRDPDGIARECARRGWALNRRLLDASFRVVVHSPWCIDQVARSRAEYASRMTLIPMGAAPRRVNTEERAAIRARFDIPAESLTVASFGFIHPEKLNPQALDAFRAVADADASALYLFVGEEHDCGATRQRAVELGLLDRVRFLGRQTMADFDDLAAVTDVGINLRRPPTNGETSAALLNLLAAGVPTIVTDVGTFADYPDDVVRKVRWEEDGLPGLSRALTELARDRPKREALGRSAWEYVRRFHEWPHVAARYVEVIERCHADRVAARRRRASRGRKDENAVQTSVA